MMTEEVLRTDPADTSAEVSGTPTNRRGLEVYGIPAISLKETLHDLEVIHRGTTGECCPRCGEKEFGKLGNYIYKGKTRPKRLCRSCGYVFSPVDSSCVMGLDLVVLVKFSSELLTSTNFTPLS